MSRLRRVLVLIATAAQLWATPALSQSTAPSGQQTDDDRSPLMQMRGSRAFAGAPSTHATIAEMLLKVREGRLAPKEFFQQLGGMNVGMAEVRQVRTKLESAGLSESFLGAKFAEGGTSVEKELLGYRRDATNATIAEALRTTSHDTKVFVAKIGRWPTQKSEALTFDSDIDFSFISADTRVEEQAKSNFDAGFKRNTGIAADAKGSDVVATAHGRAGFDVFLGDAGQSYAEKSIREVEISDSEGKLTKVDAKAMADRISFEREFVDFSARLPQVKHGGDPGLSMEMARHFIHDIQGSTEFGPNAAIVKSAKYLDRSMKAAGAGASGDPGLALLVGDVTRLSEAHDASGLYDVLVRNFGANGVLGERIPRDKVARFQQRVASAIWRNVTTSIDRQMTDFETRSRAAEAMTGEARDTALADLRGDFTHLHDTVQAELLALQAQNIAVPPGVAQQITRVNDMNAALGKLGLAVSEQELKQKRYVTELLKANTAPARKMALAQIYLKVGQGIDGANRLLDRIDDALLGQLRGEVDFDEILDQVRETGRQISDPDPKIRTAARDRANAISRRADGMIARVNVELNDFVNSRGATRKLSRGLVAIGLAEETYAYVDAMSRDGWEGLATEFFRRRVPFGSAIERAMMDDYVMAGWEVVTTLVPPLALPQAAVGIMQAVYETSAEMYWTEELNLLVDSLYASANFRPVATRQAGSSMIADWRLDSAAYGGVRYDLRQFLKQRREQVKAMALELRRASKGRDIFKPLWAYRSGLVDSFTVDRILRHNIASADPFLSMFEELRAKPEVGERLAQYFKDQHRVRWEEVKLAWLFEVVDRLESRWVSEWAANAGQIPGLLTELVRITRELEVENEVWEALEAEASQSNWQALIAWFGDLKRDLLAQPSAATHLQEAAGLVIRYLDSYRAVLDTRTELESRLGLADVRDGGLRLLTGMISLRARADVDVQIATEWIKLIDVHETKTTDTLQGIKADLIDKPRADTALDSGFDRDMQLKLWRNEVWQNVWLRYRHDMADISDRQGVQHPDEARKRLGAGYDKIVADFEEHYRSRGILSVIALDAATNKPVSGARVSVTGASSGSDRTDREGKATIGGLARGSYELRVEASGYLSAHRGDLAFPPPFAEGGRNRRTIRLGLVVEPPPPPPPPPGSALSVRIVDDATGKPIGGSVVHLQHGSASRNVIAGADGSARFRDIADGEYSIRAEMVGYLAGLREGVVLPNPLGRDVPRSITMRLKPVPVLSTVIVTVTEADGGKPVAGATIVLDGPGGRRERSAGADGRITITELPPGDYVVRIVAKTFADAARTIKLPAAQRADDKVPTHREAVRLVPARLSTLVVMVTDKANGKALVGADVMVEGPGGRIPHKTGAGGRLQLTGLPPGSYSVHAVAMGYDPRWTRDVVLPAGQEGASERTVSFALSSLGVPLAPHGPGAGAEAGTQAPSQKSPASSDNADAKAAVCDAYTSLIRSKPAVARDWPLNSPQYRNIRFGKGGLTGGQCVVPFEADFLVRGQWVHSTNQAVEAPVETALTDLEKYVPATGRSLRARMSGAATPPSGAAAPAAGNDCAEVTGTPRPNTVDSSVLLRWIRCNKIAPIQLSPDQLRNR